MRDPIAFIKSNPGRVRSYHRRALLIAYGLPSRFQALQVFLDALHAVNPEFEGLPSNPPPLEFQLADPEVMRQRLVTAGLHDVGVITPTRSGSPFDRGRSSGTGLWAAIPSPACW